MKRTVRENLCAPYSLHDMRVDSFSVDGNTLIMKMLNGMIKVGDPCEQVDGWLEFHGVDWDFCSAYLLRFDGRSNLGSFSGEKWELREFAQQYAHGSFEILDEAFGYNQTKFMGMVSCDGIAEGIIEIYHEGEMVYVTEK